MQGSPDKNLNLISQKFEANKCLTFVDLFCGLGGFRIAIEKLQPNSKCVFSCDFDSDSQKSYEANFDEKSFGDITKIQSCDIPEHDILFAGFPCQAFSICGDQKGFEDTRGTLFFDIARILKAKRPKAFVLENVKQLVSHNQGKTLERILETLENLGYQAMRKLAGNSVAIPCVEAILQSVLTALEKPVQAQSVKVKAATQSYV